MILAQSLLEKILQVFISQQKSKYLKLSLYFINQFSHIIYTLSFLMRNYVQHNSKSKNSLLRSKSKGNKKLKLSNINPSKLTSIFVDQTGKGPSQTRVTSNFLINKKYYKAALTQYQKFNANSINWYLKGQNQNDYLNLVEVLKFYSASQFMIKYQKVSAEQQLKTFIKNYHQQRKTKTKCTHFYGIYFYILRQRQNQNKTMQKGQKTVKGQKNVYVHQKVLTKLNKKNILTGSHRSSSRKKHILSTDTLQLEKLSKYLNTIFKLQGKNKAPAKTIGDSLNQLSRKDAPFQQTMNFYSQRGKASQQINEFKLIMEEQFSQIMSKVVVKEYKDDCQLYGLSQLKEKNNKKKQKGDNQSKTDKNTSDTRTTKRFSTNFQMQLSKIISTPRKNAKSKSQNKNQTRQKSHSKSSGNSINAKKSVNGLSKSKDNKYDRSQNFVGNKKGPQKQRRYNKLTDTERLFFNSQKDVDKNNIVNKDSPSQVCQKIKKIKSQKDIKISIKKKIK